MGVKPFEFKHSEDLCRELGITEEEERIVDMLEYTLEGFSTSEHKNNIEMFSNIMHTTVSRMDIPAERMEGVIVYLMSVIRSAVVRYMNLKTETAVKGMLASLSGLSDEGSPSGFSGVVTSATDPEKQAAIKKRIDEELAKISEEFDCILRAV